MRKNRTPPGVLGAGIVLALALAAAVVVAGYFLVLAAVEYVGPVGIATFVVFEAAVAVGMWLDWREARLEIGSVGRAWLVAHRTLLTRLWRRTRWHAAGARFVVSSVARPRRAALPAQAELAVVEPVRPEGAERAA